MIILCVWGGCFEFQSEELKARLKKLEELAEKKAYAELVKDITPKEDDSEPFSSYKDQLGFGKLSFLFLYLSFNSCASQGFIYPQYEI